MSKKNRLQITLDADAAQFLSEFAWARHMSKSAVINEWLLALQRRDRAKIMPLRRAD